MNMHQLINQFRAMSNNVMHSFPTNYGYMFISDSGVSLEIDRSINKAMVCRGNSILFDSTVPSYKATSRR